MDNLPVEVIRKIYEYDSTYEIKFDKVVSSLGDKVLARVWANTRARNLGEDRDKYR